MDIWWSRYNTVDVLLLLASHTLVRTLDDKWSPVCYFHAVFKKVLFLTRHCGVVIITLFVFICEILTPSKYQQKHGASDWIILSCILLRIVIHIWVYIHWNEKKTAYVYWHTSLCHAEIWVYRMVVLWSYLYQFHMRFPNALSCVYCIAYNYLSLPIFTPCRIVMRETIHKQQWNKVLTCLHCCNLKDCMAPLEYL